MATAALADRYRELGFRVIEGGKSGKIAILRTPAVAEIFGRQHKDVLESVRNTQEILGGNFRQGFAEHCRPSTYRARDGKDQPCFELTKVGFTAVASQYDAILRFLTALAFDALEHDDATAGETVVRQINARIRELRSRVSGQDELLLESIPDDDDEDDAKARHQWRLDGQDFSADRALNAFQRDAWVERYNGIAYQTVIRRDSKGSPLMWRIAPESTEFRPSPKRISLVYEDEKSPILACLDPAVPWEVVERSFHCLPKGKYSAIAIATLRHLWAD